MQREFKKLEDMKTSFERGRAKEKAKAKSFIESYKSRCNGSDEKTLELINDMLSNY